MRPGAADLPLDTGFFDDLTVGLALVLALYAAVGMGRLGRRWGIAGLALPLACAVAVRAALAVLVDSVPVLAATRGPDEVGFALQARQLADGTLSLGSLPASLVGNLHLWWMALQIKVVGGPADLYLRIGHAALAVAGIAVIAVAVSQVAGAARGKLAAWLLAFEPTSAYFSTILHKEGPMFLGEALVIAGCVRMFTRRDAWSAALMVLGVLVAAGTRPYAAAALAGACGLTAAHAGFRRLGPTGARRLILPAGLAAIAVVGLLVGPSLSRVFDKLQRSQFANATDGSNLALAPVDYTSLAGLVTNLPVRAFDVLFRPFPWQVANTSQQLGALGSVVAWTLIAAVIILVIRRPRVALDRVVPMLYVFGALLVAYALSAGNAGTGYRYHSHLVVLLAATFAAVVPRGLAPVLPRLGRTVTPTRSQVVR